MVRHAFRVLTGDQFKTKLIAFSDDMDGLRKVPDNVPNPEMVSEHLGKPLSEIPDPFEKHDSFAAHNNARLRSFLDGFGFEYEFASASDYYAAGTFDAALTRVLECFDEIVACILPTLGPDRRATYSPLLPIHPVTGIVEQVHIDRTDPAAGTLFWTDAAGKKFETSVHGGAAKCQWKADWAMRWYALKVDYEMAGKDLIESVKLSSQIVRALGAEPPAGFNYELFLDDKGQKISKSKGNGMTIDEWLTYASPESLSLFMFQKPSAAKRLYFDVIPRTVDDYLGFLDAYPRQEWKERLGNPVWHLHSGEPPAPEILEHGANTHTTVSFAMLLNLATVANTDNPAVLWGFLRRYAPAASPETYPRLDRLVHYAVAYFRDFVAPKKRYRAADEVERGALESVAARLVILPADSSAEDIQHALYDIARPIPRYQDLKAKGATPERPGVSNEFFNMIYAVLLGEERGPRLGSFIALYGVEDTRALIAKALAGEFVKAT